MKAKITFVSDLFDRDEHLITVYGKDRSSLVQVAFALEKADGFLLTNLFITDDEVKEKVESN